ncbi:MAG: hypothetical protein L0216_19190 [Planctomycetales bacterium]|nr:hypothetical protein [Planctomycetales bacterium]
MRKFTVHGPRFTGAAWLALLAAGASTVLGASCATPPPSSGSQLARALAADLRARFAGPPTQVAGEVSVYAAPRAAVPADLAGEAAALRARFARLLGTSGATTRPLRVYVYAQPADLESALRVSEGVHGLALLHPDGPIVVLASGEGEGPLRRHLRHEVAHVVATFPEAAEGDHGAAWVEEGFAYLAEWTAPGNGAPRLPAALLGALREEPPRLADLPRAVRSDYRPQGDLRVMQKLAAAAATLVHYYWDRESRRTPAVDLGSLLSRLSRLPPADLEAEEEGWKAHAARLRGLAEAAEAAGAAARDLDVVGRELSALGRQDVAAEAAGAGAAAGSLAEGAGAAGEPGGQLDRGVVAAARDALDRIVLLGRRIEPREGEAPARGEANPDGADGAGESGGADGAGGTPERFARATLSWARRRLQQALESVAAADGLSRPPALGTR